MSGTLSPAQKAWVTRRGNGTASPATSAIPDVRNPDIDLIMTIGLGESDGLAQITCSFVFMHKNKPAEMSALSMDDRSLLSIRLVSSTSSADTHATLIGHDKTRVTILDGCASDLVSILPRMQTLDSELAKVFSDSEDSSFPMALQAISWNLRVSFIEYDGKRTKRGIAYAIGESVSESVLALYGANPESA